jgi:hypothetical protein
MKKIMVLAGLMLALASCGDRVSDPKDNTDQVLIGMWDSVSNSPSACQERLRLNSDKTFWWYKDRVMSTGTYGQEGAHGTGRLNFMFSNKAWEVMKYTVSDRDLYVERMGVTRVYARVSTSLAGETASLCPAVTTER